MGRDRIRVLFRSRSGNFYVGTDMRGGRNAAERRGDPTKHRHLVCRRAASRERQVAISCAACRALRRRIEKRYWEDSIMQIKPGANRATAAQTRRRFVGLAMSAVAVALGATAANAQSTAVTTIRVGG